MYSAIILKKYIFNIFVQEYHKDRNENSENMLLKMLTLIIEVPPGYDSVKCTEKWLFFKMK